MLTHWAHDMGADPALHVVREYDRANEWIALTTDLNPRVPVLVRGQSPGGFSGDRELLRQLVEALR